MQISDPYYTQLGTANSYDELVLTMEKRSGHKIGQGLRIEEAVYCRYEGKSKSGCPLAKEVNKMENRISQIENLLFYS